MSRLAGLCACVLLLGGCAGQVQKTTLEDVGDGKALIAVGVVVDVSRVYTSKVYAAITRPSSGDHFISVMEQDLVEGGTQTPGTAAKMLIHIEQPGSYRLTLLGRLMSLAPIDDRCFGQLTFTVKPGMVNYLGNFMFDMRNGPQHIGDTPDVVGAYLAKELPDMKLPVEATPVKTVFNPGSNCV